MPLRNLLIILAAAVISLACYQKSERNRYAAIFSDAMHIINARSLEPVESRQLFEGAMNGMVEQLDEHSAFIAPDHLTRFQESLDQEFGGIGIMVEINAETKRLTVLTPLVGTPAHKAGIRAGDTILEIDGNDTDGLKLDDAVELMRGKKGQAVKLLVRHLGDEQPLSFTVVRDLIKTPSVLGDTRRPDGSWVFRLEEDPRIGLVRLTTFGEHTTDELSKALAQENGPIDALIIDLRNNAGGLLSTAVEVCDMFIDKGTIVTTRGREGQTFQSYFARSNTLVDPKLPIVILTNKFSASASEIVSACLQDFGRAVVIGERTWGKGTVQNIIMLEGGASALKLTTASYWRPSGKNIHRKKNATQEDDWGVSPNESFEVKLTDEQFEQVFKQRRQRDIDSLIETNGNGSGGNGSLKPAETKGDPDPADQPEKPIDDPQLRRAIEYLQKRIGQSEPQATRA